MYKLFETLRVNIGQVKHFNSILDEELFDELPPLHL